MIHKSLLTVFFIALCFFTAQAQTKGLIIDPATGAGKAILDPNSDGYVSMNTSGFVTNDRTESEIPYVPMVFPMLEPTGDLSAGPSCNFTDFVDSGSEDPALVFYNGTNLLFRMRIGKSLPNSKGYSVLIDTDQRFGTTGPNKDPNATSTNPGFEIEINLQTNFGVFVYNVDGICPAGPSSSFAGHTNYQKSIALTNNCGDPDYFYDFYVPFSALTALGINGSTALWMGTRLNGLIHLQVLPDGENFERADVLDEASGFYTNSIVELITDRQNIVWAASAGKGLIKIRKKLVYYTDLANDYQVSSIQSITECASGKVVGTDVGLFRITVDSIRSKMVIKTIPRFAGKSVLNVFYDNAQQLWIGTKADGIYILNESTGEYRKLVLTDGSERVLYFEKGSTNTVWISVSGEGVFQLNAQEKVLRHLTTTEGFYHNEIKTILHDSHGNVWFGCHGAELALLTATNTLEYLSQQDVIPARDINSITEDGEGNVWIATDGLGYFIYNGKEFKRYDQKQGLKSDYINSIKYDNDGFIWYSYQKGISYIETASLKNKTSGRRTDWIRWLKPSLLYSLIRNILFGLVAEQN